MKTEMFVIYDNKARAYNKPFYMLNADCAVRTFRDLANDPASEISKNPEDYSMFHIGTYDDENATCEMHPSPLHVANAHEIQNPLPLNAPVYDPNDFNSGDEFPEPHMEKN